MATTLTSGATVLTVDLLGYQGSRPSGNIVHRIPGSSTPAVSVGPTGLRTGKFVFRFISEATATTFENLILAGAIFALADAGLPSVNMNFVITGELSRELEPTTRKAWDISLGYQEVS